MHNFSFVLYYVTVSLMFLIRLFSVLLCTASITILKNDDIIVLINLTRRKLYLQRATFLYQLQRILEISGLKLDDHKVRLELLIAFEIMDEMHMKL